SIPQKIVFLSVRDLTQHDTEFHDDSNVCTHSSASPDTYPLSLHDALPIFHSRPLAQAISQTRLIVLPGLGHMVQNAVPDLDHMRSEEHTSELQSLRHLVCRLQLEKKTAACACRG